MYRKLLECWPLVKTVRLGLLLAAALTAFTCSNKSKHPSREEMLAVYDKEIIGQFDNDDFSDLRDFAISGSRVGFRGSSSDMKYIYYDVSKLSDDCPAHVLYVDRASGEIDEIIWPDERKRYAASPDCRINETKLREVIKRCNYFKLHSFFVREDGFVFIWGPRWLAKFPPHAIADDTTIDLMNYGKLHFKRHRGDWFVEYYKY